MAQFCVLLWRTQFVFFSCSCFIMVLLVSCPPLPFPYFPFFLYSRCCLFPLSGLSVINVLSSSAICVGSLRKTHDSEVKGKRKTKPTNQQQQNQKTQQQNMKTPPPQKPTQKTPKHTKNQQHLPHPQSPPAQQANF